MTESNINISQEGLAGLDQNRAATATVKKERSLNRTILIVLAVSALGVVAVYAVSKTGVEIGFLAPFCGVAAVWLAIKAWRDLEFGLKTILVVVIVEGALRKWFLPSFSELVYFYKDGLMVIVLISYLTKHRKFPLRIRKNLTLLRITVSVFAVYALTSVFNPDAPHIVVSFLGLKAYCLYIPLAFIVARVFADKEKLVSFLKWYSILVLPVAVISALQFFDPSPQAAINQYAWQEGAAGSGTAGGAPVAQFFDATGRHFVRVTGTFSYVSGLSVYLPIMFALLLGLTSLRSTRSSSRVLTWIYYAAFGATVVASLMTGSRGAVLGIALVACFFYCFASGRNLFRRVRHVAIVGVLIFVAVTVFFPQAYAAFLNRALGSEEKDAEGMSRMLTSVAVPFDEGHFAGLFGYGIGITQNAVATITKALGVPAPVELPINPEAEPGRVMIEIGILGYVLYTLIRIALLVTLCGVCMKIRDRESKALAIAILGVVMVMVLAGGAVINHTQGVYLWFLAGLPLALYNAERLQKEERRNVEFRISNGEYQIEEIRNSRLDISNSPGHNPEPPNSKLEIRHSQFDIRHSQ